MATYNFSDYYGAAHRIHREFVRSEFRKAKLDFSLHTMNAGDGDIVQIPLIPSKTWVLGAWVRVLSACPQFSTIDLGYGDDPDYWGSGLCVDVAGTVSRKIAASETWTPEPLEANASIFKAVELAGVTFGDKVSAWTSVEMADVSVSGVVIEPGVVEVKVANGSDGRIDFPSLTLDVCADKAPVGSLPVYFADSDTIDVVATTDRYDVDIASGVIEVWAWIAKTMKG